MINKWIYLIVLLNLLFDIGPWYYFRICCVAYRAKLKELIPITFEIKDILPDDALNKLCMKKASRREIKFRDK